MRLLETIWEFLYLVWRESTAGGRINSATARKLARIITEPVPRGLGGRGI
jgi:hypothetical protein